MTEPSRVGCKRLAVEARSHGNMDDIVRSTRKLVAGVITEHDLAAHAERKDCFRCLPNYGNDLRRQYNQILSEIAGSNLLSYLASQITGTTVSVNKMGNLAPHILQADYTLS